MVSSVRALGVDPGTKSFDLALVEGREVVWEVSIDTVKVAERPSELLDAVSSAGEVDLIVGPSGYGVPVTCNTDITDPRRFALEVLLLTREEDLRGSRDLGLAVYRALADAVVKLWESGLNVCYIPSVILLPTVPVRRKLNRVDLGTADKLAVTVLAAANLTESEGVELSELDYLVVEAGFGYNAVIRVKGGQVVDALGGTTLGPGFLTAGPMDLESVILGREWDRGDVFRGGVADACGTLNPVEALSGEVGGLCKEAVEAMIEGVVRGVASITAVTGEPTQVFLSGRLFRIERLRSTVARALREILPSATVGTMRSLRGAKLVKEAAQGYALIGEGLAGGVNAELVKHFRIPEARGTVLDHVTHPKLVEAREKLREAYVNSVRNPKI